MSRLYSADCHHRKIIRVWNQVKCFKMMLSLSLLKIDNISICSGFPIVFKVLTGQVIVRRVNLIVSCMKVKILISRQLTGLCRRVLSVRQLSASRDQLRMLQYVWICRFGFILRSFLRSAHWTAIESTCMENMKTSYLRLQEPLQGSSATPCYPATIIQFYFLKFILRFCPESIINAIVSIYINDNLNTSYSHWNLFSALIFHVLRMWSLATLILPHSSHKYISNSRLRLFSAPKQGSKMILRECARHWLSWQFHFSKIPNSSIGKKLYCVTCDGISAQWSVDLTTGGGVS